MATFEDIRRQTRDTLGQFTTRQKIGIATVALLTFGALIWLVVSASQPQWRTLYSDLDEATSAQIVDALDQQGIPHKLDGADTVLVSQEDLYNARIKLAGMGLPGGQGKGYELFDEAEFGMTAFTQKVNYQRALEHELSQTISAMRPVKSARVHLVLPERSLFEDEQRNPSASVALSLEQGRQPDEGQIQSIRYMVASAIESLEPGGVTIVDSTGRLLARPDGVEGMAGTDESLEAANKLEASLEDRIVELLTPMVGRDNLRARVRAELDTSISTQTDERFDPEAQAIRSQQRDELREAADGEVVGGAPGIASNLPGREAALDEEEENLSKARLKETINYEISRTVTQTTRNGYDVERLSVAVVLNEALLDADDAPEIDREQLQALVASAVGLDDARGDRIQVTWGPFVGPVTPAAEPTPIYLRPEVYVPIARYAAIALLALLLFLFVVRPLVKSLSTTAEATQAARASDPDDVPVVGTTVAEAQQRLGQPEDGLDILEETDKHRPYFELRDEVIQLGSSDIDRTSDIVRQWLRTDGDSVVEVSRDA